ncbi:MAG: hypothetical protein ABSB26_07665 [Nitrososphaerales archaeon]|jgi:hypothetical protein
MPTNLALSDTAKGEIGQTLLTLELERRGWMIFSPHIEEKVDLVAIRESANGILRHAYIQVKTATLNKQNSFEFTLQASKLIESRDFYHVLVCLRDAKFRDVDFHIIPSLDLRKVMANYFGSPTWKKTGNCNFALRLGGKWELYRNRFDFIRPT